MKKQIIATFLMVMIIVFGMALSVNASNATVTLKANKTELDPGDEFTVTLSASCEDGINGLSAKISYDEDKLELITSWVADTNNWSNLGDNKSLAIIHNTADTIKNADIFKLTFKLKESVKEGESAEVKLSEIMLDSDAAENSEHNIEEKKVVVSVKEEIKPSQGTNTGNTNTSNTNTGNTNTSNTNTGNTNTSNTNTENKTESTNKNQTQSNKLPDTGVNEVVTMVIVAISIISTVSYISYKRYKDI